MKLELITKDKNKLEKAKKYCEDNELKFVYLGTKQILGVTEYLFDIIGTKEQIEKYEDENIIIY